MAVAVVLPLLRQLRQPGGQASRFLAGGGNVVGFFGFRITARFYDGKGIAIAAWNARQHPEHQLKDGVRIAEHAYDEGWQHGHEGDPHNWLGSNTRSALRVRTGARHPESF